MSFTSPWIANDPVINPITAGAYHAVALDLGRISQEQGQTLKARLEETKAKLEAQDFTGLTKDELVGDLLYTTALMYHAELGLMKQIAARTGQVASVTWPSETIFKTDLTVDSIFGLPRSVGAGGLAMDADKLASVTTPLDGDPRKKINFLLQTGMMSSALEHSVPEQLFSTPENPAEGISAVKALQLANEQGIPIYTVNQSNLAAVLPQLQIDSQIKTDIQNAVNAGKVVTVSKSNISFNGWNGCGYIITDPETGAGAYMISGGTSGGILIYLFLFTFLVLIPWLAIAFGAIVGLGLAGSVLAWEIGAIITAAIVGAGVGIVIPEDLKEALLFATTQYMQELLTAGLVVSLFMGPLAIVVVAILMLATCFPPFGNCFSSLNPSTWENLIGVKKNVRA